MPGRISPGRSLGPSTRARPGKRKARKPVALSALELAEEQIPTNVKVQQHRLGQIDDDDDYEPQNHADTEERSAKRRKLGSREDSEGENSGSDGDGNKWHIGVDDDDDDSDLDSDEAFGDSDEEKFADFTFRGSSKPHINKNKNKSLPNARAKDLDSNMDDGNEVANDQEDEGNVSDESLGSDAVDLATAWDMNNSEDESDASPLRVRKGESQTQANESVKSMDDTDSEDDQSEEASQLSYSDDENNEGQSKLIKFVQSLEAKQDVTENLEAGKSSKLSLATLLAASQNPAHRKSLRVVQNREKIGPDNYTGGIPGKLAPPLAKRQQDRLDRAAAYEKSKETLGRWIETVKQNRRAEHISFPLPDPSEGTASGIKNLPPTSQSAPITSLEATIQEIMQESGLGIRKGETADDHEVAFEELQAKKIPIEEIQARRAELRRNRDLMFREEIRARRVKKIKSKAYRRVHRKERDRILLQEGPDMNSEEERERHDRQRAETRMGARHKESRWAKAVKASGRAAWHEDARGGMTELARKDEELRMRMEGKKIKDSDESGDEEEGSESEYEGFSEEEDVRRLHNKLEKLKGSEEDRPMSKLGSMAFMRRAEAARQKENDAAIKSLQRTLLEEAGEVDTISDEETEVSGRTRYGHLAQNQPRTTPQVKPTNEFEEKLSEDEVEPLPAEIEPSSIDRALSRKKDDMASRNLPKVSKGTEKAPLSLPKIDSLKSSKSQAGPTVDQLHIDDLTSSSSSDDETVVTPAHDTSVTRQEEMVNMLFAGDDTVYNDFEAEKKDTIVEEGDQVTSTSLPGWGSWTGEGISKREQKRNARNTKTVTTVKGVAQGQRKDRHLERVIINEKRIKKNIKYLASELPHPFESRQQYERSLRLPLGPEWTTKSTFQDATKPRVLLKQGIIKPMSRPMI